MSDTTTPETCSGQFYALRQGETVRWTCVLPDGHDGDCTDDWQDPMRDLCGYADLERFDSHDWCTRHDVVVEADALCPVTQRAVNGYVANQIARGAA
jgi:hypothetical protein